MAINKPNIPDAELPEDWGGTQYPYTEEQIENGLPEAVPTIIDGGNLNYEKRGLFQNIKYLRVFSDWLRSMPIGKIPVINSNGQLDYESKDGLPPQEGQSGKFLTTDGTNASWADVTSSTITYWE